MKIGVFDSGLGGLIILKSIVKELPEYDYVYLGDTKRLPYGNKSQKEILQFTKQAVDFLFAQCCELIIVACNTASAKALRSIQQKYLPKKYPNKRVLGVLVPAVEEVIANKTWKRVGILATNSTVESKAYLREFKKAKSSLEVFQSAAPKLVPLIEKNNLPKTIKPLQQYLKPLVNKNIDVLILGCTHYPLIRKQVEREVGKQVKVISQDEFVPKKLKDYLKRHSEIRKNLSKGATKHITVTKITPHITHLAKKWFGKQVKLELVTL